jgi:hypothetical protein
MNQSSLVLSPSIICYHIPVTLFDCNGLFFSFGETYIVTQNHEKFQAKLFQASGQIYLVKCLKFGIQSGSWFRLYSNKLFHDFRKTIQKKIFHYKYPPKSWNQQHPPRSSAVFYRYRPSTSKYQKNGLISGNTVNIIKAFAFVSMIGS